MRIIAGTYRSRRLRTVAGPDVRPTSDRLRETLFNVIGTRVRDSRFLDLCAGSGAVGIEAISRGARHAVFVEQSPRVAKVIEANLRELGISEQATLICRDVIAALKQPAFAAEPFDLIFFDPPYASGIYSTVLSRLAEGALVAEAGLVVVEYHAKAPPENNYGNLQQFRQLKQGESALALYAAV